MRKMFPSERDKQLNSLLSRLDEGKAVIQTTTDVGICIFFFSIKNK